MMNYEGLLCDMANEIIVSAPVKFGLGLWDLGLTQTLQDIPY